MPQSQETITKALDLLRRKQLATGTRGSRQHDLGNVERVAIINALKHPACRDCDRLLIKFPEQGPKPVELHCRVHLSPIELWRDWWAADENDPIRTCEKCTDPAGRPPAEAVDVE